MKKLLLSFILLLSACAAPTPTAPTPQLINVYASPAAQPWLTNLYTCAGQFPEPNFVLNIVASPTDAAIALRIGEPPILTTPSFQIDTESLYVVTDRTSPLQNLTVEQVRELFAGRGDPSVQVWVYAEGEDVQQVFAKTLAGGPVTSNAQLAVDPQQMADTVNAGPNVVGILPGHWKMGTMRYIYEIPNVPVLAITPAEPQSPVREIIACLQQKTAP